MKLLPFLRTPSLILLILPFLLYSHTLFFGATYLDDNALIFDNYWFIDNLRNIPLAFQTDVFLNPAPAYYRPFLTLSLMIDAQFTGTPPSLTIFHFTNILLHALASWLLYVVFRQLGVDRRIALAAACIFSVHPVLTQAVAWIPGRNDTLFGVWALSALSFFLRFLSNRRILWLVLHAAALLGALFTKETAAVLPVFFLLCTLFPKRSQLQFQDYWLLAMSWLVTILTWLVLRLHAFTGASLFMLDGLLMNSPVALQYLGQILFPIQLSVLPLLNWNQVLIGGVMLCGLILLAKATKRTRTESVLLAAFWFAVFLVPALAFKNPTSAPGQDLHFQHRLYVPMMGVLFGLAELVRAHRLHTRRWFALGVVGVCAVLAVLTVRHSFTFENQIVFWESAVQTSPQSPLAHKNLGAIYYLEGKHEQAEHAYLASLALNQNEPMVYNNLALIYQFRGELNEAEQYFLKEISQNPSFIQAYENIARLQLRLGKYESVREHARKGSVIQPSSPVFPWLIAESFRTSDEPRRERLRAALRSQGFDLEQLDQELQSHAQNTSDH